MLFYTSLSIRIQVIFATIAIIYGIIIFWYVSKKVIPMIKKNTKKSS